MKPESWWRQKNKTKKKKQQQQNKNKLYKSQKIGSELICTAACVHVDAGVSVKDRIYQMNTTMQTLFASLSDKMK